MKEMFARIKRSLSNERGEKEKYAPFFEKRLKKHNEKKEEYRDEGEQWTVMKGDYTYPFFLDTAENNKHSNPDILRGTEKVLYAHALALAENTFEGKTSIMVDFGGMFSLSFLHLARQQAIQTYIQKGKLALVVSNLEFTPEAGIARNGHIHFASRFDFHTLSDQEVSLVEKEKNNVHYITADAKELSEQIITVLGKQIPVKGNVGLIHEQNALTHGWINDRDIPLLGSLLSPIGTMYVGSKELNFTGQDNWSIKHRTLANELGRNRLLSIGIEELIFPGRRTMYQVFAKPYGKEIAYKVLKSELMKSFVSGIGF